MIGNLNWRLSAGSLNGGDDPRLALRHLPSAHNSLQESNRTLAQMLVVVIKKTR